jgi:putative restriction endonuclease
LLLAPHVDHLFDRGYISFKRDGIMLVSPDLDSAVIGSWMIDPRRNVGEFTTQQDNFLSYHREKVFRGASVRRQKAIAQQTVVASS